MSTACGKWLNTKPEIDDEVQQLHQKEWFVHQPRHTQYQICPVRKKDVSTVQLWRKTHALMQHSQLVIFYSKSRVQSLAGRSSIFQYHRPLQLTDITRFLLVRKTKKKTVFRTQSELWEVTTRTNYFRHWERRIMYSSMGRSVSLRCRKSHFVDFTSLRKELAQAPDHEKTSAIDKIPTPRSTKEVRIFLVWRDSSAANTCMHCWRALGSFSGRHNAKMLYNLSSADASVTSLWLRPTHLGSALVRNYHKTHHVDDDQSHITVEYYTNEVFDVWQRIVGYARGYDIVDSISIWVHIFV